MFRVMGHGIFCFQLDRNLFDLDRLHKMVTDEKEKASGRVRVARDSMNMQEVQLKEAETKALADQALADFAASEGLSIPGQAEPAGPAATRTMGPDTTDRTIPST